MSNRGPSQNFQNLNFLHFFVALLASNFLKGIRLKSFQYEMRAIFTENLIHKTNTIVYGSNETLENVKLESTEILEISFFLFISFDSCH